VSADRDELGAWAREYRQGLAPTAAALNRIGSALERIADAFAPAKESLDAGPAQPEVGGVVVADD
jgi:uncharacterized protein YbgA (DUF1722 family)